MWTHNATWRGQDGGRVAWLEAVGGVMGVLAVLTVVLNVLLLACILLHAPSRSRSFHLHIVNMAAAAILQGAGVLPLWTHFLMLGTWLHGDSVCRWWLAADTMATSVSALAIVVTACDRFIYLLCWRFVKEGGKYVTSFLLLFLSWLLALTLTLTLTLMIADPVSSSGSRMGMQSGGLCNWGREKAGRMAAARLVMYALGAGLGAGLCLALVTLPCLGRGDLLPIDENEEELAFRRRKSSRLHADEETVKKNKNKKTEKKRNPHHAATSSPRLLSEEKEEGKETEEKTPLSDPSEERRGPSAAAVGVGMGMEGEEFDEDFPAFLMVRKTNRLEERDHWKWQVTSLLAVTMAWAVLWLPSHLFVFADKLGLGWNLPDGARIAAVVVGYTHAALMPLLWLLHKPIRAAVLAFIFCRCCQDDDDDEVFDDSIEFQDVGPYRQVGVPVGVPARPDAAAGVSGSASAPPPPHDPAGTAAAQGSA